MLNHFIHGDGSYKKFGTHDDMSKIISEVGSFIDFANDFEQKAIRHYKKNGTFNDFAKSKDLFAERPDYIGNAFNLFAMTVMGGYNRIDATITRITNSSMTVNYRIFDHFGAGTKDNTFLPGLPAMYYLQHYGTKNNYQPFVWSVDITRTIKY